MPHTREAEIRENYEFFQQVVEHLMLSHGGQYALLHARSVVEYYPSAGEAVQDGLSRFGDTPFSVQRVTDKPVDLGFLSYASDNGVAVQR